MSVTWAIIPVRSLDSGKTRLAEHLQKSERKELIRFLLERLLNLIKKVSSIDRCLVVSHDPNIHKMSKECGAEILDEKAPFNLNRAVTLASKYVKKNGCERVIVIHSDLPLIEAHDIERITALGVEPPVMVISPDRRNNGTNALLIDPIESFNFHYGENSFRLHLKEAKQKKYHIEIYNHIHTSLDLDYPEDLEFYNSYIKL